MAIHLGDALISIKTAFDDKEFRGKVDGVRDVAAGLGKVFAVTAGAATGIGVAAVAFAGEVDSASKKAAASLGLPTEEAERFGDVIREVYGNNFGDSIGEVGEAVTTVAATFKRFGEASDEVLQGATEDAIRLKDAYGADVSDSINAVAALMEHLGLEGAEAMDFISAGFQRGLDSSGDFLDSISEYATQFGNAGADAGQFFSALETGLQSGVLGTDKAGDMFKEFAVRIQDGSETTSESLKALGINSEQFLSGLSTGQLSVADAFQLVQEKLRGTSDQATVMQAGVGLLGTQFEDLGVSAALSVDLQATKMRELSGATMLLDGQYDTLGSSMSMIWRQTLLMIEPIGQALLPHLKTLANYIADLVPRFRAWIEESGIITRAVDYLTEVINQHVIPAVTVFMQHLPELIETLSSVGKTFMTVGEWIADAFGAIHDAWRHFWDEMAPGMILGFENMVDYVNGFVDSVISGFTSFRDRAKAIWDGIVSVITNPIDTIMGVFSTFDGVVDSLMGHSTIPEAFENLRGSAEVNFMGMADTVDQYTTSASESMQRFAVNVRKTVEDTTTTISFAFLVSEKTLENLDKRIAELEYGIISEYEQSILTILKGRRKQIAEELEAQREQAEAELSATADVFESNLGRIKDSLDEAVGNSWMPELLDEMVEVQADRLGQVRSGFSVTSTTIAQSLEDLRETMTQSALIEMPDAMGIAEDSITRFRDTTADRLRDVRDAVSDTEKAFASVGDTAQRVALNSALELTKSAELFSNSTLQVATEQARQERYMLGTTDLSETLSRILKRVSDTTQFTDMVTTGHYQGNMGPITIQVGPGMDATELAREVRRQLRDLQMQTMADRNRR